MKLAYLAPDRLDLYNELFRADFAGCPTKIYHNQSDWDPNRSDMTVEPLTAIAAPSMQKPVLISGFRRYHANKNARLPVLLISPARVFKATKIYNAITKHHQLDWIQAGWIIALKKLTPANHVSLEAAGVLKRSKAALKMPLDDLIDFCPALAEFKNPAAIITAASLPIPFLKRCQSWNIDVTKVALLANYCSRERAIATVLTCLVLKLSVSNMRRFERLIRDLAQRQNISVLTILSMLQLEIRKNPKRDDWLTYMEKIRSPERAIVDETVEKITRTLEQKPIVNLSIPDNYEGDYFDVTFRIASTDDLDKTIEIFSKQADDWKQLLHLIQKGLNGKI